MLRILNTQSRAKEEFKPLDPSGRTVLMYTCGPTVYGGLHLGHARFAVTADIVRRYLLSRGYQVRFVMNITDVDDKIIREALRQGVPCGALTTRYAQEFHDVLHALNVQVADMYPRATDHIPEMIEIVKRLLEGGHAYQARDGDLYFDTASFAGYGGLSGRRLEEEEAGLSGRISDERLAVKRNKGDFLVWKLNRNDPEEFQRAAGLVPGWDSPWGLGRPGWHLECSAMSAKYLGVPFDIHAGGQDLVFPHHEDEKAQTECAFCERLGGRQSVRYWIHNAMVNVKKRPEDEAGRLPADLVDAASGGVKMSKSLGNVKWLQEMFWPAGPYDPMAIRMMLLGSHYRSPIVFEPAMLDEATARLDRIYNALESVERALGAAGAAAGAAGAAGSGAGSGNGEALLQAAARARAAFQEALDDDFNTAGGLAAVFELVGALNQALSGGGAPGRAGLLGARAALGDLLATLGIRASRGVAAGAQDGGAQEALIGLLMKARREAREAKQFALADSIRNGLSGAGYEVKDLPGGKWEVKKQ